MSNTDFGRFWRAETELASVDDTVAAAIPRRSSRRMVLSAPAIPTAQIAAPGERTPGFHLATCITPKPGLDHTEFIRFWHERFRDVAIETQSTFDYVRNEIVFPLTPGAPHWAGIGAPKGDVTLFVAEERSPSKETATRPQG